MVRSKAAVYCLAHNEDVDKALETLNEIANKKENGIFGFNARMTLEVWEKQGYLRMYQEK